MLNFTLSVFQCNFNLINRPDYEPFGGFAFQIGVSPGFFIGETSISLTACTGVYHAGTGFIGGGSIDVPLGYLIMDRFGDVEFVENMEEVIKALEFRITGRSNVVRKTAGGTTGWIGGGISLGYEF